MKNMRRKERGKKQNRRAVCLSSGISAVVFLCLILSLFLRPLTVYATAGEAPDISGDKNKNYSIRVMMVFDDKTVEGGSFEAYRVGEIVKLKAPLKATSDSTQPVETPGGDAYRFWPTESLVKAMGLGQDEIDRINNINRDDYDALSQLNAILSDKLGGSELNGIETAAQKEKLAKTLAAYVQNPAGQESEASRQNDAAGAAEGDDGDGGDAGDGGDGQEMPDVWGDDHVTRENENGEVTFEDLRTGLYLFTQSTEQAAPGYYPVEPFLVSVPILAKEGYDYAVEAYPNDHEVKIYVKFRLMALAPDPPGPDPDPDPEPDPPGPDPDPDPDPDPEPGFETWVQEHLADPLSIGEPSVQPRLPQTGQINWPVPVLAVCGSAMLLFGMALHLRRKIGKVCTVAGIMIMMTGLYLFVSNQREAYAAGSMAKTALTEVKEAIEKQPYSFADTASGDTGASEESDALESGGYEYIGYISVPSLKLELPVMDEWDYARLKIAPCRYYGSDREDNMVIAAHNYAGHFGMLSKLEKGDEVFFTDMDGRKYSYEVEAVDILAPEAVEEMTTSEYNLTLFTCTYGGANRVTVRCFRKM